LRAFTDESLQGAKGKTLQKEIGHYCSALVEALEDDLAAAVRAESFNASQTHELLCKTLSNACRGPQVRSAPAMGTMREMSADATQNVAKRSASACARRRPRRPRAWRAARRRR
jgi:hypothetical protein